MRTVIMCADNLQRATSLLKFVGKTENSACRSFDTIFAAHCLCEQQKPKPMEITRERTRALARARELFAMFTIHKIISLLRSHRILLKQLDIVFDGVCFHCAETIF